MRHGTSSPARLLLSAAGLALAVTPLAAATSFAGVRQAKPIEVLGTKTNVFDPKDVTATPDDKGEITVTLTSEAGGAPHTWENKALGIDSGNVNAGESKTITFKAPPAGQHKIICLYHEGTGMVGTLTVAAGGAEETPDPDESPTAAPSSQPPASASASATVGAGEDDAPEQGEHEEGEEGAHEVPGVEGNKVLERIAHEREAQKSAVDGFKFFTFACVAFLFILGAAVLFSTRPRRTGR